MTDDNDIEAPGWDAIDRVLERVYGKEEPLHYGTILPASLGGSDPLQGISVYCVAEPFAHWHFVTYGFSELYGKEWNDPTVSGFGFELTFRLRRREEDEPPTWAISFLQNLGRYVFSSGNSFDAGHHLDLNGPIALESETSIRAVAFQADPVLQAISTPNGTVSFVQVVGITLDELNAIKRWNTVRFLDLLATKVPLGMTDLDRESVLSIPELSTVLESGAATDGSSTGALFVASAGWEQTKRLFGKSKTELVLGANGVRDFKVVLPGRIPFDRQLTVAAADRLIVIEPSEAVSCVEECDGDVRILRVRLTALAAREIGDALQARAGVYTVPSAPTLSIRVEKSYIKNQDGDVEQIIG